MKTLQLIIICLLLTCGFGADAQTITTYAGNGGVTPTVEGVPATSTTTVSPANGAFDAAGNYYCMSGPGYIKKVSASGIISIVVGGGTVSGGGDGGPATAAGIACQGMHVDSAGNIYIADYYNFKVRKVDAATGIIHTIAGTGSSGSTGNGGAATLANMAPVDVITDDTGNVYIADNNTVRKLNIATGIITQFSSTNGWFCFDANYHNLYMGGATRLFRQNMSTGVLDTIAGTGVAIFNGDNIPATAANFRTYAVAIDLVGNIYLADDFNDRIRMINTAGIMTTVAGTGVGGYNGDNIAATAAQIYNPEGLAFDKCGNLYIADDANHRVRKVAFNPTCTDTPSHVGVVNVNSSRTISVYPNPVWGELCVDAGYGGSYTITNITGYAVLQGAIAAGKNTIPTGQLPAGIYFVAVVSEGGERRAWKVVKE